MPDNAWATAAGGADGNAWGSAAQSSANPWRAAAAGAADNPWGKAASGATGALGGLLDRLGMPKVIDLLDRPRQTVQAAIAGDDPLRTLLHHAGPDQQNRDRAVVRAKMHLPGAEERAQGNGLRGGVDDFAVDTVTDPMSLLGGFVLRGAGGLIKGAAHAAGGAATKHAPGIANDVSDAARAITDKFTFGGSAKRELGDATYNRALAADNRQAARQEEAARRLTQRFEQHIAPLAEDDKRTVYRVLNGEEQIHDPASGRLIVKPHVAEAVAQARKLTNDMAAIQGDETARRKLAYGGGKMATDVKQPERAPKPPIANVDDLLAGTKEDRGDYLSRLASSMFADGENGLLADGGRPIEKKFGPRKLVGRVDRQYDLPDDLKEFAAPPEQGILNALNIRSKYLPGPHAAEEISKNKPERSFNLLRPFSPNAIQRDEFKVGDKAEDMAALDDAFRGAIANAARQGTAGKLRAEVGVPLNLKGDNAEPDALHRLFERTSRATGDERSGGQKFEDYARRVIDIPKNTVTAFGLKHGVINVPALALASEGPGAALEALVRGGMLVGKKPGERYDALKLGIEGGVVTPFTDRKNSIVDAIEKTQPLVRVGIGGTAGAAGGYEEAKAHDQNPLLGALLGAGAGAGFGKFAPELSRGTNTLTWAIDDAAKAAVLRRKIARGMDPDKAAAETMREMVDYRHRSAVTEGASKVAPFATFRTRIPAAVASSTTRNPARALALDRASQSFFTNGKVQAGTNADGTPRKVTMTTPTSDVFGGVENPMGYARAMLADPLKAIPTGLIDAFGGGLKPDQQRLLRYLTYGQPLLPHTDKDGKLRSGFAAGQAANYLPLSVGESALGAAGLSEYKPQDFLSALLGSTLGIHVR